MKKPNIKKRISPPHPSDNVKFYYAFYHTRYRIEGPARNDTEIKHETPHRKSNVLEFKILKFRHIIGVSGVYWLQAKKRHNKN